MTGRDGRDERWLSVLPPAKGNSARVERHVRDGVMRAFIVIPCLNEAEYIGELLDSLLAESADLGLPIVVVDGGSDDGTQDIVQRRAAASDRVALIANHARLQSAGVNLAVALYGDRYEYLIRLDAHGSVPRDFCKTLLAEAEATSADSVVCSMLTRGVGPVQEAIAIAQSSRLGNGGAAHRRQGRGQWVDHGHHALMRVAAFRAVGGYDESFACNEDAELDCRLRDAGFRIWLTARTAIVYYPRASLRALFRQYVGHGRGRARTALKHRLIPRPRQLIPLATVPSVLSAPFAVVFPVAVLPAAVWGGVCLAFGVGDAVRLRRPEALLAGPAAMTMHLGWSLGFCRQLFGEMLRRRVT